MRTIRKATCGALVWAAAVSACGTPVEVTPSPGGGAFQPQVACDDQGRVFVVYGQGNDILLAVAPDSTLHFAAPIKVGALPKLALGMRRGPRIATSGLAMVITAINDRDLFAFHSADAGRTWSAPRRINSVAGSAREGLGNLAAGPAGLFYATWLDLRSGATEVYGAMSSDGGKTWGANDSVYHSPDGHVCECCHPSAAFNARGDLVVMWRNWLDGSRDLWLARRTKSSAEFEPPVKQGSGTWKIAGCPMDGGAVFALDDGSFASVWQREGAVYLARTTGEELFLAGGKQPLAVMSRGVVHLWWQQGADLMHATKGGVEKPGLFAKDARFASVAVSPQDGTMVVAFERAVGRRKTIFADALR